MHHWLAWLRIIREGERVFAADEGDVAAVLRD